MISCQWCTVKNFCNSLVTFLYDFSQGYAMLLMCVAINRCSRNPKQTQKYFFFKVNIPRDDSIKLHHLLKNILGLISVFYWLLC